MSTVDPAIVLSAITPLGGPGPARRRPALWGLRITFAGLLCVTVLVTVTLAAMNSEANLLLLLTAIGCGLLIVNAVMAVRSVRWVGVDRNIPDAVLAGRAFSIAYTVRSHRRWLRCWGLIVGEIQTGRGSPGLNRCFIAFLDPGQEQRVEARQVVSHRGRLRLQGMRVQSRFPFGLFSCTVEYAAPAELIVYPTIGRFRRDPWRERANNPVRGASAPRREAVRDEFFGLREYRQGDNYRWIHWRRSASTGELLVREMRSVQRHEMLVIVDPWPDQKGLIPSKNARRFDPAAERIISVAAAAICDGLSRGYRVGLIGRAAEPVMIPMAGGRMHRQRLLRELALLNPGATLALTDLMTRVPWATSWQARAAICTPRLMNEHEGLVRHLRRKAEAVVIFCPEWGDFATLVDFGDTSNHERRIS